MYTVNCAIIIIYLPAKRRNDTVEPNVKKSFERPLNGKGDTKTDEGTEIIRRWIYRQTTR
jgi:hypothetical protein